MGLWAAESESNQTPLLESYLGVTEGLAADDLDRARRAATALADRATAAEEPTLAAEARALANAESLEQARKALKSISRQVEPMAKTSQNHVVMTCPMAAADWVQAAGTPVENPYYGKSMLRCGGPKQ